MSELKVKDPKGKVIMKITDEVENDVIIEDGQEVPYTEAAAKKAKEIEDAKAKEKDEENTDED
jgi:hypothetical protein